MSRMYFYIKILKKQYIWSNNLDLRILNFPHMFVYWNHIFMVSNKFYGHSLNVLTQALLQFRFYRNKDDIFLFIYNNATNILLILAYVDDLIITGNNDNLLQNVIQQLNSTFALKDLGNYNTFLVKFVHSKKYLPFTNEVHQLFAYQSLYARMVTHCPSNVTQRFNCQMIMILRMPLNNEV